MQMGKKLRYCKTMRFHALGDVIKRPLERLPCYFGCILLSLVLIYLCCPVYFCPVNICTALNIVFCSRVSPIFQSGFDSDSEEEFISGIVPRLGKMKKKKEDKNTAFILLTWANIAVIIKIILILIIMTAITIIRNKLYIVRKIKPMFKPKRPR